MPIFTRCLRGKKQGQGHPRRVVTTNKLNMAVVSEYNAAGQKEGPELQFYYNGSLAVLRHFESGLQEVRTVLFYTPILFTKSLTV